MEAREMFDVTLLDRMSFKGLNEALHNVLVKMRRLAEERAEGEDDPRRDVLLVIANQIIVRMDSIIRDQGPHDPVLLDQWRRLNEEYRKTFSDYVRTYLKDGVPLVMVEPESSSRAQGGDADYRAKLDELVLDEKVLEGMNAGDLFEVNHFIIEKIKEIDERLPEDVAEPIIEKLLKFATIVIRRLDPLVRETYKDRPENLAAWEAMINDYKDLVDEDGEHTPADDESSNVS